MEFKKLSIIIPARNEERTIKNVLERIFSFDSKGLEKEIIVINDGSTDSTLKVLEEFTGKIKVIDNNKNIGKSKSAIAGILASTGDLVVVQDADLELAPEDLTKFIEKFQNSDVDAVMSNRFHHNQDHIYNSYGLGGKAINLIASLFIYPRTKFWSKDILACYKMIKGNIAREVCSNMKNISRFGFETVLTLKLAKYKQDGEHLKLDQIDVYYKPRSRGEGKHINAIQDGMKIMWEIVKNGF